MWAVQMMFLKYQLPSEPNVYVDLLDDEDVSLMFDEVRMPPLTACLCQIAVDMPHQQCQA